MFAGGDRIQGSQSGENLLQTYGARWVGRRKWICGTHFKQGPTIKSTVREPLGLDIDADDRGDIFFRVNCFVKSVDKPGTLGTKTQFFPADTPKTNKKRYPYWLLASLVYKRSLPCFTHKLATMWYHLCYNHAMWLLLSSLTSLLTKSSAHETMPTARARRIKWCQRLPACIRGHRIRCDSIGCLLQCKRKSHVCTIVECKQCWVWVIVVREL